MHRLRPGLLLITTAALALALQGCLGKSTPNPGNLGVKTVTLSPSGTLSIEVGGTQPFSVTATDANGHAVFGNIGFIVTSGVPGNPAPLSITSNGNACAGSWDQSQALCRAGTPGIAIVSAVVEGVSSPPTTVYVHYHIDSLQAANAQSQPPDHDCFSQRETWLYQAIAYSNNQDITNSVGPLSWNSTNPGVLTAVAYVPPGQPNVLNQVQITADSPGITQIYATVSGTTSNTLPITTCLVQYVRVQAAGNTTNSISVNNGGSIQLQADAVDTLGNTLSKPPLTWSTTSPEVVSFSSLTNTTGTNSATARNNLGGATVTASCAPPTCNIGVLPGMPVYASNGAMSPLNPQPGFGAISVDVTPAGNPAIYSAWAATNQCGDTVGCTSVIFQITPGTNPIGGIATLPRTPNSMMFNYQSSGRIFLGSNQGLMYLDAGSSPTVVTVSSSPTPCNVSLCGVVLAISNDGKQVVVGDNVSATPQVYIYNNSTSAVTDLVLPSVATAAAFSPDQSKVFILTQAASMYVYSTVDALGVVPLSNPFTSAAFSGDGSFAYVAGPSSVSAFSTCALPNQPSVNLGNVTPAGAPLQIFPSPAVQAGSDSLTQKILALEPPNIQVLTAQWKQTGIADGQFTCNPPVLNSLTAATPVPLGEGNFIPLYSRLVGNGSEMIIVAQKIPAVLVFSVTNGTTSAIPLVNNGDPLAASSSSDGGTVYVASCDQYQPDGVTCAAGSVHIIDSVSLGDFQQVPYNNNSTNNMCNNLGQNAPLCIANMVAIKPQ